MSAAPWIKFYPRDWRGDQALRAVSVAARGLWIECLCIMHEAKPYGHLVLNGEPVEGGVLARMTGTSVDEVSALMAELRQAGVLSVTAKGVVFSRRMTKDHARAQKGSKAAKKRWSQDAENKEQSEQPNRSPNSCPITQKPEARSQNKSSDPIGSGQQAEFSDDRTKLFGEARRWLERRTEKRDGAHRALIGRWLKETGDDASAVLEAIRRARDADVADPVSWITAALKGAAAGEVPEPVWIERLERRKADPKRWHPSWTRECPRQLLERYGFSEQMEMTA